jgi:hypothetical protein
MSDRTDTSSFADERLEILRLVETQVITADEASRLLEALDRSDRNKSANQFTEPFGFIPPVGFPFGDERDRPDRQERRRNKRRNVRIRISNITTNTEQLNLVLPHPMLETGLKMARRLAPDQLLEAKGIKDAVEDGFLGPLLDVTDGDQRVEIIVEDR